MFYNGSARNNVTVQKTDSPNLEEIICIIKMPEKRNFHTITQSFQLPQIKMITKNYCYVH